MLKSYILLFFVSLILIAKASPPDFGKKNGQRAYKHEIIITPNIAYGNLSIISSPVGPGTNLTFGYSNTNSPLTGCTISYTAFRNVNFGLSVNYQTLQNISLSLKELNYLNESSPYSLAVSPEYGFLVDFFQSTAGSLSIEISEQPMQCTSIGAQQSDYPYSLQINSQSIALQKLFNFQAGRNNELNFYAGGRAILSFWEETDNWNGASPALGYVPFITSSNNIVFNLQLILGVQYFITPHLGLQLEGGAGRLYYAQFAVVIRFYGK